MPARRRATRKGSTIPTPAEAPTFRAPEPPQRSTGWRHLPEERWPADRIHPAPYNAKVRRMSPEKFARLKAGFRRFGLAGTLNVRAEDGLMMGGEHRFRAMLEVMEEARQSPDFTEAELERLGVAGGLFRVSPILGIPDAEAAALSVLLNNREAQGEFNAMGLAEVLTELDATGFDVTDTGFDLVQVESLVTWEPDETREGGAKSGGADAPGPDGKSGSPIRGKKRTRAGENADSVQSSVNKTATDEQNDAERPSAQLDAGDCTLAARALYRLADAEPSSAEAIRATAERFTAAAAALEAGDLSFAPNE